MQFEYEPVINETKANKFELVIEYMHGDADAYTKSIHYFPITDAEGENVVKPTITFLKQIQKMDYDERRNLMDENLDQGLLEWDNQYLDQVAEVDSFELYFYNINGTKFKVKITDEKSVETVG